MIFPTCCILSWKEIQFKVYMHRVRTERYNSIRYVRYARVVRNMYYHKLGVLLNQMSLPCFFVFGFNVTHYVLLYRKGVTIRNVCRVWYEILSVRYYVCMVPRTRIIPFLYSDLFRYTPNTKK